MSCFARSFVQPLRYTNAFGRAETLATAHHDAAAFSVTYGCEACFEDREETSLVLPIPLVSPWKMGNLLAESLARSQVLALALAWVLGGVKSVLNYIHTYIHTYINTYSGAAPSAGFCNAVGTFTFLPTLEG